MERNLANQVLKLLRRKKIKINSSEFKNRFFSHPEFPHLISIVETLDYFGIPHGIYEVGMEDLSDVDRIFLGLMERESGKTRIALIENRGERNFYVDSVKISMDFLQQNFKGIVLKIEKSGYSVGLDSIHYKIGLGALFLIILIIFKLFPLGLDSAVFFVASISGFFLTLLTQSESLIAGIPNLEKICKRVSGSECGSIIHSKKWKILEVLDFADLSLIFFGFQFLYYLFSIWTNSEELYFQVQAIHLTLAIPVILTSFIYQKYVVKKWCAICVGIFVVLGIQISILAVIKQGNFPINWSFLGLIFILLGVSYLVWRFVKKKILFFNRLKTIYFKRNRYFFKYRVFKSLLMGEEKYELNYGIPPSTSPLTLTLVTDPFCDSCKDFHKEFDKVISNYHGNLRIDFIFNSDVEQELSINLEMYRRMVGLQFLGESRFVFDKIHQWYEEEDRKKWINSFSETENFEDLDNLLQQQKEWCETNGILHTPNLLVNGYSFPSIYEISDLTYFLDDLVLDTDFMERISLA